MLTSELAYVAAVTRDIDAAAAVFGNVLELPRADLPGPGGSDVPRIHGRTQRPRPSSSPATLASTARTAPASITSPSRRGTPRPPATRRRRPGWAQARSARPSEAARRTTSLPPRRAASSPGSALRSTCRPPRAGSSASTTSGSRPTTAPAPRRASRASSATRWRAGRATWRCRSRSRASPPTSTGSSITTGRPGGSEAAASSSSPSATRSSRVIEPLEFGPDAPEVVHGQRGDTRQDMGTLARFVDRRGPGLHHVAFKVPDADEALRRSREGGCRMIDDRGRPGSRRAMIGFIHPARPSAGSSFTSTPARRYSPGEGSTGAGRVGSVRVRGGSPGLAAPPAARAPQARPTSSRTYCGSANDALWISGL